VRFATPLFLALVLVEFADVIFAVDSVPAVFAITDDPFIVYTSNIFAILGLRALYFALAAVIHRFHYLKYALSGSSCFIGSKIFIADLLGWRSSPALWSLASPSRSSRRACSSRSGGRGRWDQGGHDGRAAVAH
jgi:tellurite resistance protein TerC